MFVLDNNRQKVNSLHLNEFMHMCLPKSLHIPSPIPRPVPQQGKNGKSERSLETYVNTHTRIRFLKTRFSSDALLIRRPAAAMPRLKRLPTLVEQIPMQESLAAVQALKALDSLAALPTPEVQRKSQRQATALRVVEVWESTQFVSIHCLHGILLELAVSFHSVISD
jgi:hypothetical protein